MRRFLVLFMVLFVQLVVAQGIETMSIWPDAVPGEEAPKAKPIVQIDEKGVIERLLVVTNPVLEVYRPQKSNGAAVLIFPGGGYSRLAIKKEGYEIAEWLSGLGYTAFVLQYRVPDKQEGALMDAQRAIRIVRSRAGHYNLNPEKIGVLGFSAGGSLAARAATRYDDQTYPIIDEMDSLSSKPNFSILIYPAYLDQGENNSITPELKVTEETAPMFLFVAADDNYANSSLVMTQELRKQNVLVELHVVPFGKHGYGMRKGNPAAEAWPPLAESWLKKYITK
ncbi:MAG: alpha/beta hydrolase [Cyclobacteriaceae bacterium]|nr:alpha/beta hydrolase [Cyclobacteriaceae bacterium SS2]